MMKKLHAIIYFVVSMLLAFSAQAFAVAEAEFNAGTSPFVIVFIFVLIVMIYIFTQVTFKPHVRKFVSKWIVKITLPLLLVATIVWVVISFVNSPPLTDKSKDLSLSGSFYLTNNQIEESSGQYIEIGKFVLKDTDIKDYTFTFPILDQPSDNDLFSIDGNTLFASYSLKYDFKNKYKIQVEAYDPNGNLKDKKDFTVNVTPLLLFKDGGQFNASFVEKNLNYIILILLILVLIALMLIDFTRRVKHLIRMFSSYFILFALLVASIYPLLYILMISFKRENALYSPTFLPVDENGNWNATLEHYISLFSGQHEKYVIWFWNTLQVSTLSMIFGTILTILASYALSRFKFRGRQTSLMLLLVLGMFPGFMAMIAIFIFLQELNIHDTHFALILVYSLGAPLGGVFVAKGFYDTIPKSLEEAARIDGASQLGIFVRIVLPLSKPMLTFISLTIFTGTWVDFIFAKIIIFSEEKLTLAVGLLSFVRRNNEAFYNAFAAGSVLAAIPITLLFIFLQRFLVEGLTAGASKG